MSDPASEARRGLLERADQFLKRRRTQLGNPMMESPVPTEASANNAADDIPVLTEIVDAEMVHADERASDGAAIATSSASGVDIDLHIAREVDAWLDENLPQVVMHALDGITDRLIAEIHESARFDLLPRLRAAASAASTDNDTTDHSSQE